MDQKIIRGIGNAYADEILWEAGISPFSVCNKIPDEKIKRLSASIHSVLQDAEKQIKKSNPDIISGEARDSLNVHNAKKTHSPRAELSIIKWQAPGLPVIQMNRNCLNRQKASFPFLFHERNCFLPFCINNISAINKKCYYFRYIAGTSSHK